MTATAFEQMLGWAGPTVAAQAWQAIGSQFPLFALSGDVTETADKQYMALFEIDREVLGRDHENFPQATGDCVSQGARGAIETVQCQEIKAGDAEEFHPIFAPYLYGTGRVLVGNGQLRGQPGSVGAWQAKAVELYGAVASDGPDVPEYSGKLADEWGDKGPPQTLVTRGKQNLIQTTARIFGAEDGAAAIVNGYPFTIACNQGFENLPRSDGFHWPKGSWPHQMVVKVVDRDSKNPYFGILNSWGDVHGVLKDFRSGVTWPKGMLRVRWDVMDRMIRSGEAFAYSRFQGFPAQTFSSVDYV